MERGFLLAGGSYADSPSSTRPSGILLSMLEDSLTDDRDNLRQQYSRVVRAHMYGEQAAQSALDRLVEQTNSLKKYPKDENDKKYKEEVKRDKNLDKLQEEVLKSLNTQKRKHYEAIRKRSEDIKKATRDIELEEINFIADSDGAGYSFADAEACGRRKDQYKKDIEQYKAEIAKCKADIARLDRGVDRLNTQLDYKGGQRIPHEMSLDNGQKVQIIFGDSEDGFNADHKVNPKLVKAFKAALNHASEEFDFHTIYVSTTTNGEHSTPASNHYPQTARALDISRIDGETVKQMGKDDPRIKALQDCLEKLPDIRENFGPALFYKLGEEFLHDKLSEEDYERRLKARNAHYNHIHFSVNE